jgi:predicted dehydrogenase
MDYNTTVTVIGGGNMGKNHARVFNDLGVLKAIVEPDYQKRKKLSKLFPNIKIVTDAASSETDAYVVSTPTSSHFELAKSLLECGKDILIEKPVCKTLDQARELLTIKKSNKLAAKAVVAVGHVERFNPVVDYLSAWLKEKQLKTIETYRLSSMPTRIQDVGVFQDLGIHDVDVVLSLVNSSVKSVFALSTTHNQRDLYTKASIKFENGVCAFVTTSWLSSSKIRKIRVSTSNEDAEMDYLKQCFETKKMNLSFGNNHFQPQAFHSIERIELKKEEPLMRQAVDFLDAIQNTTTPKVTLEQGYEALKIVDYVLQSVQSGKNINVKR